MKPSTGFIIATLLLASAIAKAELLVRSDTLRVSSEISAWNEELKTLIAKRNAEGKTEKLLPYTECREVQEIHNVFLCASDTQVKMNMALNRASFFIEGLDGTPKGTVLDPDSSSVRRYATMVGGHDLKGKDLLEFYKSAKEKCATNKKLCLTPAEEQIFSGLIIPQTQKSETFVVITYAISSRMRYTDVVTHEILHAQFFAEPAFQEVAAQFWAKEVSEEDRAGVRNNLSQYYDATNDYLMMNEFQAYILMAGAESNQLAGFVSKYREPLMRALNRKGIQPLQVK